MSEPRNSRNSVVTAPDSGVVMDVQEANVKYLLPAERQLPKGYKQTELGLIPEDWGITPLATVTSEIGDGIHSTPAYSSNGDYYFINGNNISNGQIVITSETKTVDLAEYRKHGKKLDVSSILLSINGTIGNVGLFSGEQIVLGKSAAYLNVSQNVVKMYVYYAIQTDIVKQQFSDGLTGSTIKNLGLGTIRNSFIPIPPTKAEQEAIAEALSDADALIEALEQLIAKKRQLKQGAMQELLTGKRRLPGFEVLPGFKKTEIGLIPNDWDTPSLGDILKSTQLGGNYSNSNRETNWPLIKMGNLVRGTIKLDKLEFIDASQIPAARDVLLKDDVLFNTRNTIELVGKVAIWRDELPLAYFNSNIMRMEFIEERVSSKKFINYILNTPQLISRLRGIAIGTTSVAAIYGRDLVKVMVPLPTKPEQTAIAQILTDMDTEITELESKLTKARAVKQGMMQQLLTGRIRLIGISKYTGW